MLHRSAGVPGNISWRQFARKGSHGRYDPAFSFGDYLTIAREVREYENAFLTRQISFPETIHEFFILHNPRHDPEMYKQCVQQFRQRGPVMIKVYPAGEPEECRVTGSPV